METHVEFRSDKFPPFEGEEKLVNPDLWGKRLADFLREGLRKQGFETDEPIAEDWGWVVPVVNKSFRLWIGCGHYQEYEDGFLCFIEPHKPFVWRFFKRVNARERVTRSERLWIRSSQKPKVSDPNVGGRTRLSTVSTGRSAASCCKITY